MRINQLQLFYFIFLSIIATSCVPLINKDAFPKEWHELVQFNSEDFVRDMYSTKNEMFVLSNNNFFRFDTLLGLKEKRPLLGYRPLLGSPTLTEKLFLRVLQGNGPTNENAPFLELHLIKNPLIIKQVNLNALIDSTKKETFNIDANPGRFIGCFNEDGSKYFLLGVVIVNQNYYPTVLVFDIKLKNGDTDFDYVKLTKKVTLPELRLNKWQSCRYLKINGLLNGNFYVATEDGGYRITPTGSVQKVIRYWVKDFFEYKGRIYATSQNSDLYASGNDGKNFAIVTTTELQYVEVANQSIFSQNNRDDVYNLADTRLTNTREIAYTNHFPKNQRDSYYDVIYFHNNYFVNKANQIFYQDTIQTK